jgi:hypothetical protein
VARFRDMGDLMLERAAGERRLYKVRGVGTISFDGLLSRAATAEAGEKRWRLARRGFWGRRVEASDTDGATIGTFEPHGLRRGGHMVWAERELRLQPASAWRERYALVDRDHELAIFDGKEWGRKPVAISIDDPDALDPGLVLFTAFVVRGLAADASAGAAASIVTR